MNARTMATDIAKLELREGDVLVLKTPGAMSVEQGDRIRNHLAELIPGFSNKVLILDGSSDLQILRPETPPAPPAAAFNLDAAIDQARQNVARCIEASHFWHSTVLGVKFMRARSERFATGGMLSAKDVQRFFLVGENPSETILPAAVARLLSRQRGGALAQILGLVLVIAFALGVFGPNLDRLAFSGNPIPVDHAGEIARFEAEARQKCNALPTDNRGWIQLKDGAIVCTDKRGRVRSQITTLVRAER